MQFICHQCGRSPAAAPRCCTSASPGCSSREQRRLPLAHTPAPPAACGPVPRRRCRSTYIILKSAACCPLHARRLWMRVVARLPPQPRVPTPPLCATREPSVLVPAAPFSVRLRVRSHQCAHAQSFLIASMSTRTVLLDRLLDCLHDCIGFHDGLLDHLVERSPRCLPRRARRSMR